ncbi:hypothetical protein HDU98_008505, partial [Podochytrium sp. JEL0797]
LTTKISDLQDAQARLAESNDKLEDCERVLEATTMDRDQRVKEFKDRLGVKEDLEGKLLVEVKSLKGQLAAVTQEKNELAVLVEQFRDEEREHDDLVKQLAQLATKSRKRGE